jgi:hypothetical protein
MRQYGDLPVKDIDGINDSSIICNDLMLRNEIPYCAKYDVAADGIACMVYYRDGFCFGKGYAEARRKEEEERKKTEVAELRQRFGADLTEEQLYAKKQEEAKRELEELEKQERAA